MEGGLDRLEKAMDGLERAVEAYCTKMNAGFESIFQILKSKNASSGLATPASMTFQPITPIASLAVLNTVVKPCIMAPTTFTSCTTLHTSTPKNLPPVLVRLSAPASAAPLPAPLFAPKVSTSPLPPHQPFPLKQASPLLSIQQPTILLQFSSTSQPPDPAPVTVPNPVCMYSTPHLPHTIILPKGLCSWLLHTVGVYWSMHLCVGWLQSFGKLIDTRPWKIWVVF